MPTRPYDLLLSTARLKPTALEYRRSPAEESLSDKMRIVNCSAFRRLQNKAQVFSLARAGDVRTRLTHSVEVSIYGELVAERIVEKLLADGTLSPDLRLTFVQTVANACLLHDVGNPPFGHMGEYAIRQWFEGPHGPDLTRAWVANKKMNQGTADSHITAFREFDGNPQGLRVITRLQWFNHDRGLNLTCSLLAAYCKYIGATVSDRPFHKKLGFFPSEKEPITATWEALGLTRDADGVPAHRHPLAFIMEAADDIAYCLSDIEDALEKNVVTEHQFFTFAWPRLPDEVRKALENAAADGDQLRSNGAYHHFRVSLSKALVDAAVDRYFAAEGDILRGSHSAPLLSEGFAKKASMLVKDFAGKFIYASRDAVETVVGGLSALNGILDAYFKLLIMSTTEFERLQNDKDFARLRIYPTESQLYSLLPRRHILAYRWHTVAEPALEPVYRTQLVLDYLSGMTDTHALKVYNMINGTQTIGIE